MTSPILSETESIFSSGVLLLCFSMIEIISLKLAGLPLNISVASTAIFCAVSLSTRTFIISFAISFDGSCISFKSSISSLNFIFAALVNAGLYMVVCNPYNSSTLIESSYSECARLIVLNNDPKSPSNTLLDTEPLYWS